MHDHTFTVLALFDHDLRQPPGQWPQLQAWLERRGLRGRYGRAVTSFAGMRWVLTLEEVPDAAVVEFNVRFTPRGFMVVELGSVELGLPTC